MGFNLGFKGLIYLEVRDVFPIKKKVPFFITEWNIFKPAVYLVFPKLELTVPHKTHHYEFSFCIHHSETLKLTFLTRLYIISWMGFIYSHLWAEYGAVYKIIGEVSISLFS